VATERADPDRLRRPATPTYLIVNKLKRAEGVDVYDRDTNFIRSRVIRKSARRPGDFVGTL
jgi:hypothetical protein